MAFRLRPKGIRTEERGFGFLHSRFPTALLRSGSRPVDGEFFAQDHSFSLTQAYYKNSNFPLRTHF